MTVSCLMVNQPRVAHRQPSVAGHLAQIYTARDLIVFVGNAA
jgi:hypothetical protein